MKKYYNGIRFYTNKQGNDTFAFPGENLQGKGSIFFKMPAKKINEITASCAKAGLIGASWTQFAIAFVGNTLPCIIEE